MKWRGKSVALSLLLSTVGVIGLAAPAHAAASTDQARSLCGAGYSVIDGMPMGHPSTWDSAVVYLLYSGSTGKNCVVTILNNPTELPFALSMSAKVRAYGGSWVEDTDLYFSYAGPVYVSAPGKCVQFYGKSNGHTYTSPWAHCG